jgi:hypothetical protein
MSLSSPLLEINSLVHDIYALLQTPPVPVETKTVGKAEDEDEDYDFLNTLKNLGFNETLNENTISSLCDVLITIPRFKEISHNKDKLVNYMTNLLANVKQDTPCAHFKFNIDYASTLKETTDGITATDDTDDNDDTLLLTLPLLHCLTCGHYRDSHKLCGRFQELSDEHIASLCPIEKQFDLDSNCETCGLGQDLHVSCDHFILDKTMLPPKNAIDTDFCANCRTGRFSHLHQLRTAGHLTCYNYVNNQNDDGYCLNCYDSKSAHMYTKLYRELPKNIQFKISTKRFELTMKFTFKSSDEVKYIGAKLSQALDQLIYVPNYIELLALPTN